MLQPETSIHGGAHKGITGSLSWAWPSSANKAMWKSSLLWTSDPDHIFHTKDLQPFITHRLQLSPGMLVPSNVTEGRDQAPAWTEKIVSLGADGCSPAVHTAVVSTLFLQQPRAQHLSCSRNLCQGAHPASYSNSWIYSSQILLTLTSWGNSKEKQGSYHRTLHRKIEEN